MRAKHYAVDTRSAGGTGAALFASKADAEDVFNNAFCFDGIVSLLQGNFTEQDGVITVCGEYIVLDDAEFDREGELIPLD